MISASERTLKIIDDARSIVYATVICIKNRPFQFQDNFQSDLMFFRLIQRSAAVRYSWFTRAGLLLLLFDRGRWTMPRSSSLRAENQDATWNERSSFAIAGDPPGTMGDS